MSDPYLGQLSMFAGNFAPRGWSLCDGQLLPIAQYTALFSLLGTIYGGDGRTTFGLPDMRGRLPVHHGNGPGLTSRRIGESFGSETVALTANTNAAHNHTFEMSTSSGTGSDLTNGYIGASPNVRMFRPISPNTNLSQATFSNIGSSQPHPNMMPYQCVNFIIALQGVFPSRT